MYWGIPPEINAFRLTRMGAGPAAHAGQVAAYGTASATYFEQGSQAAVTAMATSTVFEGAGGTGMMGSAMPASAWMSAAGTHASTAVTTLTAGVEAYSAALAATIPHEVVVANRVREAVLQATNILGQNTPAIGEANAEYAEYWGQNASSMMGYLAAVLGVVSGLSVPLAPLPQLSDPVSVLPAALGALSSQAIGAGVGILSAGFSAGMGLAGAAAGASTGIAVPTALGNGSGLPVPLAPMPSPSSQGGTSPAPATESPPVVPVQHGTAGAVAPPGTVSAPPAEGGVASPPLSTQGDFMQLAQPMMGAMTSAPSMLSGALSSPLSSMGQISGLMGPLSSLAGGMSGGLGQGLTTPGLSAAGSPWSGLSGANGGFAGGGSAVTASLTKPSAGAGMGGPIELPEGWWARQPSGVGGQDPVAGLRTSGAAAGGAAMGSGLYGAPMGAASARRGAEHADLGQADKSIDVAPTAHRIPIFTTAEGVVYTGGQGG